MRISGLTPLKWRSGSTAQSVWLAAIASILTASLAALLLLGPAKPAYAQNDVFESIWGNMYADEDSDWEDRSTDYASRRKRRKFTKQWEMNPPRGYPTIAQQNVDRMRDAIHRYSRIVSQGGWRDMPLVELRLDDNNRGVQLLRHRLQMSGDLQLGSGYSRYFDSEVERGVKSFQMRHGLTPTGVVDKPTMLAMNVPAMARLRQLRTNLVRIQQFENNMPNRYVIVNIPSAQIEAIEGGQVVSRHSAVVGKLDRQTPLLRSDIHEINFNPFWTVPRSIVRKDLVPKALEYERSGKDIMAVYRMNAYDRRGNRVDPRNINWRDEKIEDNLTFRQDPWEENSMGFVKINFHNKYAVFMHDTPSKSLFGRNIRAESSGCVRVQNVEQLVNWLLRDNYEWNAQRIEEIKQSGDRVDVPLRSKVPLYFVYLTAWATPDGKVNFRRDLYNRDNVDVSASSY